MAGLLYQSGSDSQLAGMTRTEPVDHIDVDNTRSSPVEWVKSRRVERGIRRAEAAHSRLARRMGMLGDDWHVLDLKEATGTERGGFLAIGPGGVYSVTVKNHGRSRINFAGDIVQIDGRRPKYVEEARENAKVAAEALARTAGVSIPVRPVLAFAGSGKISFHGLPQRCIVTSYQDLGRVLHSRGMRMAPDTVDKVFAVAVHPATWMNPPYVGLADRYRWYPGDVQATDGTGADKRTSAQ